MHSCHNWIKASHYVSRRRLLRRCPRLQVPAPLTLSQPPRQRRRHEVAFDDDSPRALRRAALEAERHQRGSSSSIGMAGLGSAEDMASSCCYS